jgi:bifunctional UDP-N-acetylglucosamine pyrophosphorylase/glucosamine-1-phosphate N-acetyltransferase
MSNQSAAKARKGRSQAPRRARPPQRAVATPQAVAAPPLSIVVLAAGQGKRMQSALPKVLQPLAGRPLLAHVLELADSLEPAAVHIVIGHAAERVREQFEHAAAPAARRWVLQDEQLGTGHAVRQAMPQIPDEHQVLVLYGDVPLLRAQTLRELCMLATAGGRGAGGSRAAGGGRGVGGARAAQGIALLTALLDEPAGYGRIVRDRRRALRRIVEDRDAGAQERGIREVNSGVLAAPARLLKPWLARLEPRNAQREYYLSDVVALAVRHRLPVATLAADPAEILGINDRLQLAQAEAEYRRRRARALMERGVTVIDPARLDVRGSVEVGRDVVLDVNVVLDGLAGPVRLGDGVRLGPNCVVANSAIGARTRVHANCVMQDADIGEDCSIGPFTRLRPGARLAGGVHLGNFVEVKNSEIGAGSKVNHLSYVGDSTVGSGVNIGAGTITVNYDGANKWRTRIGDDAFIGSGSMLVAPVSIGAGANVGAGSTITADAPEGKLTLARARQVTIEGWQRPRKATKP